MQAHPQNFDLSQSRGIIPESPGKYGAKTFDLKNGAQGLQKNKQRPFLELAPKKVFMVFVGENLQAKVIQKLLGKFGEIWVKIHRTPENLRTPTPMVATLGMC